MKTKGLARQVGAVNRLGKQTWRKLVSAGVLAGLFVAPSAQAFRLDMVQPHQTGYIGDTLIYEVWARDVTSPGSPPEIVSAFDIDIAYDPDILLYAPPVVFGSGVNLDDPRSLIVQQVDPSVLGKVNVREASLLDDASLYASQPDSFVLFSLAFTGIKLGTSPLSIGLNAIYGHSEQDNPCPPSCNPIPVELKPAPVTGAAATILEKPPLPPNGAPEPSMLALVGLGLLGLLVAPRNRAGRTWHAIGSGPESALRSGSDGV
jgi:hypothetical protein